MKQYVDRPSGESAIAAEAFVNNARWSNGSKAAASRPAPRSSS
ncbi:MAG: hypothetical protein P0120_20300 [Nitrospira sp.]|nr:hypothetical protein [Nitrospira sp.]